MRFTLDEVDSSWRSVLSPHLVAINTYLSSLEFERVTPPREMVFRALTLPIEKVKVVIFGQDPYPKEGMADGLAFSSGGEKIPASLRNIFKELASDLGIATPDRPDLSPWHSNGVLLLNRTLTTIVGESNAHQGEIWSPITSSIAQELGSHNIPAILWGAHARELAPHFAFTVESAHPSPLSARHGFFGSRPFSHINEILASQGREIVDWTL